MGLINLPLPSVLFLMKFYEALSSRCHRTGERRGEGGGGGGVEGGVQGRRRMISDTSQRINRDSTHINKCDTSAPG